MSDYLEAKRKLVSLEFQLQKFGSKLSSIGEELTSFGGLANPEISLAGFPTVEKIKTLLTELEKVRSQKNVAESSLRQLGFENSI